MKTEILTLLFLLGASGSGQLLAQETERQSPPPRPSREQMHERLLQQYDTDGDGVLSKQERQVARAERPAQRQARGGPQEGERMQGRRGPAEGERFEGRRGPIEGERAQGPRGQGRRGPIQNEGLRERRGPAEGERMQRRRGPAEGQEFGGQRRRPNDFEGQRFQGRRGPAGGEQLQGQRRPRAQEQGQAQQRPGRGGDQGNRQQRPTKEERRARLMQHFDTNRDGVLDEVERTALKEAMESLRAQTGEQRPNREARQGRGRQERESANAPRSDRRQFPR